MSAILWNASESQKNHSNIVQFMQWLQMHYGLEFDDYKSLYNWSIESSEVFWKCLLSYFNILFSGSVGEVCSGEMPKVKWFEGLKLNYGENLMSMSRAANPLIIYFDEVDPRPKEIKHSDFYDAVMSISCKLRNLGIKKGDRVAAYLPNIPETSMAFQAVVSRGAIWSCCSPDFGADAVVDRYSQIEPKVLFVATSYSYGGKIRDRYEEVVSMLQRLPSVEHVIEVPYLQPKVSLEGSINFKECLAQGHEDFSFERVDFNDPLWVLYSSGTTGKPKAITHSHGGMLLEHLKYLTFHNEVKQGQRFFWYSTTGWMMWNFTQAAMLTGATIVLYDGSATFGGLEFLWRKAEEIKINHFGTSAPYLIACMKNDLDLIKQNYHLQDLITIGSTGSPLPPEAFDYVYDKISSNVWLCSMSGGTDAATAFVGSNILSPVVKGFIQCRALGVDIVALNERGEAVVDEVGEMVIRKAMPCMPIYFWNDKDYERYKASYFEEYGKYWRHGDWIKINSDGQIMIMGRSDATLNRNGVRIGTAEIYNVLNDVEHVVDCIILNIEKKDGSSYMPLYVVMNAGFPLDFDLKNKINKLLKDKCSPRHVPDEIIEIAEIPYTISGKKMEAPVKKLLMGVPPEKAYTADAMRNPSAMDYFILEGKSVKDSSSGEISL